MRRASSSAGKRIRASAPVILLIRGISFLLFSGRRALKRWWKRLESRDFVRLAAPGKRPFSLLAGRNRERSRSRARSVARPFPRLYESAARKKSAPLGGIVIAADWAKPSSGGPTAITAPPLPIAAGLGKPL